MSKLKFSIFILVFIFIFTNVGFSAEILYSAPDNYIVYSGTGSICIEQRVGSPPYGCALYGSSSYKYITLIDRNWLTTTSCNPSISSGKITANFAISGDKATVKSYLETYNRYDVLTNNLYMKVNVIYGIRNSEGIVITESDTISSYASPEGYAIPTNHKFTQTYVENLAKNLGVYGNYQVFVDSISPIDTVKCAGFTNVPYNTDYDFGGLISISAPLPAGTASQCSDGEDNDNDGLIDLVDSGCTDALDNDETDAIAPPSDIITPPPLDCYVNGMTILHGTGKSLFNSQMSPTCLVQYRLCDNGVLSGLESYIYASCQIDTDNDGNPDISDTDDDNDSILDIYDNCPLTSGYLFFNGCPIAPAGSELADTTVSSGFVEMDDDLYFKKSRYDLTIGKMIYKDTGEQIILPVEDKTKSIKIIKDGVNIRNDTIQPEVIALKAHMIRKPKTRVEAEQFIGKSYDVMTKLNITKDLDTTTSVGNTQVSIKLDIPQAEQVNLTVYQIIPKPYTIDDIKFISDGGAQRFIVDKDPVIGWYFNESNSSEEIIYELPGANEGGTIIITQEPILYNEGELIVNYRETACAPGEAEVFDIEDLLDSKIYAPASAVTYKVCIAHQTLSLQSGTNNLFLHLFNYTNAGNLSFTQALPATADVSVVNTNPPIYWDLKIQRDNPNGNYSCLGSFIDEESSLFGDCGFNPNKRIWLHLGEDYIPPTTELYYPTLAHTLKVFLNGTDNIGGSGLYKTYYCVVDQSSNLCKFEADYDEYKEPFIISCDYDWGCLREVKYFSTDNAGNKEDIISRELILIDKGSACQADCSAKPKPDRIIKDCRNLNGCEFYPFNYLGENDGGEYVAEQCNYATVDSWVDYNSTHEIMCPNGPIRESRFSSLNLELHESVCDHITKIQYPAIVDGQQVTMNFIYCADFN